MAGVDLGYDTDGLRQGGLAAWWAALPPSADSAGAPVQAAAMPAPPPGEQAGSAVPPA